MPLHFKQDGNSINLNIFILLQIFGCIFSRFFFSHSRPGSEIRGLNHPRISSTPYFIKVKAKAPLKGHVKFCKSRLVRAAFSFAGGESQKAWPMVSAPSILSVRPRIFSLVAGNFPKISKPQSRVSLDKSSKHHNSKNHLQNGSLCSYGNQRRFCSFQGQRQENSQGRWLFCRGRDRRGHQRTVS